MLFVKVLQKFITSFVSNLLKLWDFKKLKINPLLDALKQLFIKRYASSIASIFNAPLHI